MDTQKQALTDTLNSSGFTARLWEKHGYTRIYLSGYGKDIKAHVELDDPESEATDDLWYGARLSVSSRASAPGKWIANRVKQVKHGIMCKLSESKIVDCEVCEDWRDVVA